MYGLEPISLKSVIPSKHQTVHKRTFLIQSSDPWPGQAQAKGYLLNYPSQEPVVIKRSPVRTLCQFLYRSDPSFENNQSVKITVGRLSARLERYSRSGRMIMKEGTLWRDICFEPHTQATVVEFQN